MPFTQDMNKNSFAMIREIKSVHNQILAHDLPLLDQLTTLVLRNAADDQSELREIRFLFVKLLSMLSAHIQREGKLVYPTLLRHEVDAAPISLAVEHVADSLKEHDQIMDVLRQLRQATNNYRPDYRSSSEVKLTYEKLQSLEKATIELIHFENTQAYDGYTA
ncbi:MAG: hypothetical protein EOM08_06390 [Clostridia bacterium]|nr:hypothetical protein [Clostridia bacterium]